VAHDLWRKNSETRFEESCEAKRSVAKRLEVRIDFVRVCGVSRDLN